MARQYAIGGPLGAGYVIDAEDRDFSLREAYVTGTPILPPPGPADAWDYLDKSANVTLSGSDKIATMTSASAGGVRSVTPHLNGSAGKYYAEFVRSGTFSRAGLSLTSSAVGSAVSTSFVILDSGDIYVNGSYAGASLGFIGSSVFCIAWDAGAEKLWFRYGSGLWNNNASANPATGVDGLDASAASSADYSLWGFGSAASGSTLTLRTELAEFTQAVPSGFTSWMGEEPVGGGISVPVTGVSATGAVGTVTVATVASISVPVTGVQATGAVGSVTVSTVSRVDVAAPVTGVEATGSAGSVSVTGKASTAVTGVQATGAVGTVTTVAGTGASVPVTGISAAGQVGSVTATGKADATVTGAQAAGSVGSVAVTAGTGVTVPVTGVAAAGAVDSVSVTGKANVSTTGVSAIGTVGGVSVVAGGSISIVVTGISATGSVGSVTVTAAELAGMVSVWNGSAWVDKPAKVWTGSAWMQKPVKHWSGSAWV